MYLTFLILTIFLSQSNGFLFDRKPLFPPPASNINNSSNGFLTDGRPLFPPPASNINNSPDLPVVQVTGGQGGNGGAGDIPEENGKSNVQIQRIDNPHSMTMTQTDSNGKSHDLFMTNQNHSMTMTQTNPDGKSPDLSMTNQNHSMTMTQTNPDGKSPDLSMVMNNNQSMINTLAQAPIPSHANATNAPNTNKMMWYNNNANKPAGLFMLPNMMLSTTAGNQSSVIVTGGNGADASDGGKDGSVQVQTINGKVLTKTN